MPTIDELFDEFGPQAGHGGKRTYYKCMLMPVTNGPGSDIRLSWPACVKWEAA